MGNLINIFDLLINFLKEVKEDIKDKKEIKTQLQIAFLGLTYARQILQKWDIEIKRIHPELKELENTFSLEKEEENGS